MEMKGYTFGYGGRKGDYLKSETYSSLDELCRLGINWVTLAFDERVARADSLEIRYDYNLDLTDYEMEKMIGELHDRGLKVCLKPMINTRDHQWRAYINFGDDGGNWAKWFYEYTGFMLHYAEIAERTGCEMFCLGCEMLGMERQEKHWRELIAAVRQVYSGLLTYNTNHGHEQDAKWYDALDIIGTSGYFPVGREGADYDSMRRGWRRVADELQAVSEKWNKPIVFMEAGCRSAKGASAMPWDYEHREFPESQDEQADFFASCLDEFADREWFKGVFWWDWGCRIPDVSHPMSKIGFSIYGKRAFLEVKKRYEEM